MGGWFSNYFNRFGPQWQVYNRGEGDYRTRAENVVPIFCRIQERRGGATFLLKREWNRAQGRSLRWRLQRVPARPDKRCCCCPVNPVKRLPLGKNFLAQPCLGGAWVTTTSACLPEKKAQQVHTAREWVWESLCVCFRPAAWAARTKAGSLPFQKRLRTADGGCVEPWRSCGCVARSSSAFLRPKKVVWCKSEGDVSQIGYGGFGALQRRAR